MMRYTIAGDTDIGLKKTTNQDSLCMKLAETASGQAVLVVLCDGMGGLSKGELASATVVKAFVDWFEKKFPEIEKNRNWQQISGIWENMIIELNERLLAYGCEQHVQLGTTISAMLISRDEYLIAHVGDSRIYKITDTVEQMTEDQTVVAREIKRGMMTEEEARKDSRRNVLLQCVGASQVVVPQILTGKIEEGATYLFCSDGFRHTITSAEIWERLRPEKQTNGMQMKQNIRYLINLVKVRNEQDNITAALVKVE